MNRWLSHLAVGLVGAAAGFGAHQLDKHPALQNFIDREAIVIRKLGFACGVERWSVKTLADSAAAQVNYAQPQPTTIGALIATPSTGEGARAKGVEETVFRLQAKVIAFKQEADSDIHLELQDTQGHTMIAELPLQSCVTPNSDPTVAAQQLRIGQARASFERTLQASGIQVTGSYQTVSIPATLEGVGFYDFLHGQRGVAPNGVELHPLLSFIAGAGPPPPPVSTTTPSTTTAPTTTAPKPPPPPPVTTTPSQGDDRLDELPGCSTYPGRIYFRHVRQSHCQANYFTTP